MVGKLLGAAVVVLDESGVAGAGATARSAGVLASGPFGHELRPKVQRPFMPVSADAHPRGVGTWQRPDLRLRP